MNKFSGIFGLLSGLFFGYLVLGFLEAWTHQTLPLLWSSVGIVVFFGLAGLVIGIVSLRGIIVGDAILIAFGIFSFMTSHRFSPQVFFNSILGEIAFLFSAVGLFVVFSFSRGKSSGVGMKSTKKVK